MSDNPFPKDWHRLIRAARQKLTGDEFDWCLNEATRIKPLTRLSDEEVRLFGALEDSQDARIARSRKA